jgi:hypothetical protein
MAKLPKLKGSTPQYKQVVLPTQLFDDIEGLGLTNIQKNKAYHFIDYLMVQSDRKYGMPYCFTSFSYGLFLEIFNSKYMKFVRPLKELGIIDCDEVFSVDGNKPHNYRVHKDYFTTDDTTTKVQVAYYSNKYDDSDGVITKSVDFIKSLYIPYDGLREALEQKLYDIAVAEYVTNHGIKEESIKVFDGERHYYIGKDKAIEKATKLGVEVFEDGGKYFLMDKSEYKKMKLNHIKRSYQTVIENLRTGNIHVGRNRTNNRLDTNLTNMPSCLYNVIAEANNLMQVDAVNSQYAILADIMKNEGIESDFIKDAQDGNLYENVEEKLNLKDRDAAKKGLMQVIFAPSFYGGGFKDGLKKLYPELIAFSDGYKEDKGHNQLAIMLQKFESGMYIDEISNELQQNGVECTSKHDSIICRASDVDVVLDTMKEKMMLNGFVCQLKAS